ncbi:MAG TPA: hypothetical protein VMZ31_11515 [Phycisphaerae bacterium]|nr:hypothetical protein [Phycisphaerae bacterium]
MPTASQPPDDPHGRAAATYHDAVDQPGANRIDGSPAARAVLALLLFAFGAYQSVLFFGHTVTPHPDMWPFVRTGHELLAFETPTSFKRAPLVGLLQAGLSRCMPRPHPDLTAAWLLNAMLHPLSVVLLWLVARRIVGQAGFWVALLASINPWLVYMLTEGIAETTLLFFVLATCYFVLRHSRWSYLFACLAMMARYDAALLLILAFAADIAHSKTARRRVWAVVAAALAALPLAIWLLATWSLWDAQGQTHYLKELGAASGGRIVLAECVAALWRVAFYPLLVPPIQLSDNAAVLFYGMAKILAALIFALGIFHIARRRQWAVLALAGLLAAYLLVHAAHSFVYPRFFVIVHWIALAICAAGLQLVANKLAGLIRPPQLRSVLVLFSMIVALAWVVWLARYLPQIAPVCPPSASLPYVAVALIALVCLLSTAASGARHALPNLAKAAWVALMVVSNQFVLVPTVGDGLRNSEFRQLADWYAGTAQPGEALACSQPGMLRILAPGRAADLVHFESIKADTLDQFTQECRAKGIAYVAWDSRVGLYPRTRSYRLWHMARLVLLGEPRDVGPYQFITQLRHGRQFINVFRLQPP